MVEMIRQLYGRLDRLQQSRLFKIVATCAVLLVCGAYFGTLIVATLSLDRQRDALTFALTDQNLPAGDELAVSLEETGTVHVGGRTYGNERLLGRADLLFDDGGSIASPTMLAEVLLRDQYPTSAPTWMVEQPGTTWMLTTVTLGLMLLVVWMAVSLQYILTLVCTTIAAIGAGFIWGDGGVWACVGIGNLTFTFVLLTRILLVVLDRPHQLFAVAHTVVKEASRTKVALVFIVCILVLLPLLPLGLDPDSPLRFRIQTFLSRGLGFTFYLAACMTVVLSCATVAFEIRDRQIWQVMTKPVSRFNYLLGKWLGVVSMNLIIMAISAVSIFTFIQYLRNQPVARGLAGVEDAQQVEDAVLTARVGTKPRYEELTTEQMRARVDEAIQRDPELAQLEEVPLVVRRVLREQQRRSFSVGQRTVPPQASRTYVFDGLESARSLQSTLTLRYRFHIMRDDEHETFPAFFVFNEDPDLMVRRTYVPTMSHVLTVPVELIREDGTLSVTVVNMYEPPPQMRGAGSLNFEVKDFELLYKVGSFESNFVRAIFVDWVKLSFLAMLGICCATFLSFPVACLTAFTIFAAGTIGPFLALSLEEYFPPSLKSVDWGDISSVGIVIQWAFQSTIKIVAQGIVFLLEAFGHYRPTQSLVEGRLISWHAVAVGTLKVGVLWSGLSLLVGWVVLRSRQLAIYSGHG